MDFFRGDYNSRRDIQRVQERIATDYEDFASIAFDDWANSPVSGFYGSDTRYQVWLDKTYGRDYTQQGELFPELPPIDAYNTFKRENYDTWYEEASEDGTLIENFLEANYGGNAFSNIYNNVNGDLSWPYWTEPDYDNERGRGDGPPVNSFTSAVGYPADVSQSYHGRTQRPGHFMIEQIGRAHV